MLPKRCVIVILSCKSLLNSSGLPKIQTRELEHESRPIKETPSWVELNIENGVAKIMGEWIKAREEEVQRLNLLRKMGEELRRKEDWRRRERKVVGEVKKKGTVSLWIS